MNTLKSFARYWLPAIIWMIIIFLLSGRQRVAVSTEPDINFLVFKTLHMIEYAALYFLLFRGFYSLKFKTLTQPEKLLIPFIVAMFYAATDEYHQTMVPNREGTPRDVIVDTAGIFFMYIYIRNHIDFVKKFI